MAISTEERARRERQRKNTPEYKAAQHRRNQLWRRANPEAVKAYNEARSSTDAARKREKYSVDPTADKVRTATWKADNPQGKRAQDHLRRARSRDADGRWAAMDIAHLEAAQSGLCAYCNLPWEHVDHVIPLAHPMRGTNDPDNLQLLCAFHNLSKGARTDEEYRAAMNWPTTGKPIATQPAPSFAPRRLIQPE